MNESIKKAWYTSWTIWANVAAALLVALNEVAEANDVLNVPSQWIVIATIVLNLVLRIVKTNSAIDLGKE